MKAIILAGGLGTRLHPLTVNLPKPMVPVLNRPLMTYVIDLLAQHGYDDISVLLYHQPDAIRNYFSNGKKFLVKIKYFEAPKNFGTAGAVKFACGGAVEPVLVISADLITNINLSAAADFHKKKKALATLVLTRVKNPLPYGIIITHFNGRIKKFLEKPSWGEVFSDTVNAGIYLLDPAALKYIPDNKNFDFSHDLFPLLLSERKPIYGYIAKGDWEDIGKLDDYVRCNQEILRGNIKLSQREEITEQGLIGPGSTVSKNAIVINSTIGKGCKIAAGAYIKDSILWDGVEVAPNAKLEKVVLANRVKILGGATLDEGVVVGDESEIGANTHLKSGVKVWPHKVVESGSMVSRHIIWKERWSKSIFGPYGVTGVGNVDITPQFAASLGAAYGTYLGKGARIACSRDTHKASRMIYRALVAGVLSAGVDVSNLEMVPIPVNRYEVRSLKSKGGFHVRKSPFDPNIIDIKFFDHVGMDICSACEKKIERLFFSDDFSQVPIDATGELSYPFHRVAEEYKADLLRGLNLKAIRASGLKIVIDYAFGSALQIFPAVLGELGIEVVALNAYIDETKITKDQAAFNNSLEQLTQIVKSVGADFGVMLDTGGEKIFLCDQNGHLLNGNQTLGVMLQIVFSQKKGRTVALPSKESRTFDQLAKKMGGKILRTKNTLRNMMEIAADGKVALLGESLGGFIFPDHIPAFDAILSTCKLIEYFSNHPSTLADLTAAVFPVSILHREIPCPAEVKGKVLRRLTEQKEPHQKMELLDGVKIWHGQDWVLMLPDSLQPCIHIYVEADSPKNAQAWVERYAKQINKYKE